jgi:hypothetical protein
LDTYYDLERAHIVLYESWTAALHKIEKIEDNTLTLVQTWDPRWSGSASGARMYIENVIEALDTEG